MHCDDAAALADRLLREFGSVASVLGANPYRVARVQGSSIEVARLLSACHGMIGDALRPTRPAHEEGWLPDLVDYLRHELGSRQVEHLRVVYLDSRRHMLADDLRGAGTIDAAPAYPREIIHRALDLGASELVMAHNHPSGLAKPSRSDIELTRAVAQAGRAVGVELVDHIIVTRDGSCSFRALGLI